ncbi:hypothetical protein LCGC14_0395340 [marine sediment metagenome]|uniref:Uncharacterized protein n=1 Tax=marine sediment metagenome TaxID=412755 RepID=A0A0F9T454_9ZZZZ
MDYQQILNNMPNHLKPGLQGQELKAREGLLILYHIENNPTKVEEILKMSGVRKVKFCDCYNGIIGYRVIKKARNEKPIICRCTMRMIGQGREGVLLVDWKGYETREEEILNARETT